MKNPASYRPIGRGKVAEHKRYGSDVINVIPIDQQPYQEGELVGDIEQTEAKGVDARGNVYTSTMKTSKVIAATWLGHGDNRVTAPDVRRDEMVDLFEFHDTHKIYWQAISGDHGKRRKEKVTHRFSMTDDESTTALDDTNSISVDHDGENGMTTINVPSVNGKAPVTFQMNSKAGSSCILVGEGNFVQIEADGAKITSQNESGTFVTLEGDNIETNCKGEKKYTTGTTQWTNDGTFNIDTALFNVTSKGNATIVGTTVSVTGSAGVTFKGPTVSVKSDGATTIGGTSVDVETPVFNLQAGDVQLSDAAAQAIARLVDPYITHP